MTDTNTINSKKTAKGTYTILDDRTGERVITLVQWNNDDLGFYVEKQNKKTLENLKKSKPALVRRFLKDAIEIAHYLDDRG